MTALFDKLNLRPGERRLVMFVALTVFIVLNAFFVWPKFFEWGKVQKRKREAEQNLHQYQQEVQRTAAYQRRLSELERQGAAVGSEDQALRLQSTTYTQGGLSGVNVTGYNPVAKTGGMGSRTNAFFDEQAANIQFNAEEKNLIDFLYNLGIGGSMIRVRQMTLNPDPPKHRLQGTIMLVASYARTAAPRPGAAAATAAAAAAPRTNPAAPAGARSMTNVLRGTATNAPAPKKEGWLSRLWPFGKKQAEPVRQPTNAPARPAAPARTNAPPNR